MALNDLVLDVIRTMPSGGGYAANAMAMAALRKSVRTDSGGRLDLEPKDAQPSFCSGATYLILLAVFDQLHRQGRLELPANVRAALEVKSQPDGTGVWGRWNANGPGTARLFHELGMGRNFTSYAEARAGDFIKMFWNENIGSSEKGHSAIFLGISKDEQGADQVTFWSSNIPGGYGVKDVPKSQIKRALFSRLENPQAVAGVAELPAKDAYLAAMLKRPSTEKEMLKMVGLGERPEAPAAAATGEPASPGAVVPGLPASTLGKQSNPTKQPSPAVNAPVEKAAPATPEPKKGFFQKIFGK
jgi:hypothetical protein